jgi:hypothetical protein
VLADGSVFEGELIGANPRAGRHRRGRVQHRAQRLPGGDHRPELRRPDHHLHVPAHRQLRHQRRRLRVARHVLPGRRRARARPPPQQPACRARPRRSMLRSTACPASPASTPAGSPVCSATPAPCPARSGPRRGRLAGRRRGRARHRRRRPGRQVTIAEPYTVDALDPDNRTPHRRGRLRDEAQHRRPTSPVRHRRGRPARPPAPPTSSPRAPTACSSATAPATRRWRRTASRRSGA